MPEKIHDDMQIVARWFGFEPLDRDAVAEGFAALIKQQQDEAGEDSA